MRSAVLRSVATQCCKSARHCGKMLVAQPGREDEGLAFFAKAQLVAQRIQREGSAFALAGVFQRCQ